MHLLRHSRNVHISKFGGCSINPALRLVDHQAEMFGRHLDEFERDLELTSFVCKLLTSSAHILNLLCRSP